MANETVGFRTSLVGFHKKDVLACIDRLSFESLKAEQDAKEKIDVLQAQLNAASSENEELRTKASENTAVVSRLLSQAQQQQQQAQATAEKCTQLETKVATLDGQNQDFRRRLFQGEEESVRLRRENDQLRQECTEKQALIERQTAQLAELKTTCETRLDQIHSENEALVANAAEQAEARVRAVQQQAESRVAQAEQELAESRKELEKRQAAPDTETLARSLAEVKHDLSVVGENVSRLSEDLQRSMQMLEAALAQAEQKPASVEPLPADATKWEASPSDMPGAAARQAAAQNARQQGGPQQGAGPAQACGAAAPKAAAQVGSMGANPRLSDLAAGVPTVAERLLDKLAKLLEQ